MTLEAHEHPVRLTVEDDLRRSRLTVFLRLLLVIPHAIWFLLWTILIIVTAIANWVISLFTGRPPGGLHRLMCGYIRYQAHLTAYISLTANPYPASPAERAHTPWTSRRPPDRSSRRAGRSRPASLLRLRPG